MTLVRTQPEFRKKRQDSNSLKMRNEAMAQVAKGRLEGPPEYTSEGGLLIDGDPTTVNPASRFGAQQADVLRFVDDFKRSSTNEATSVRAPIHLPSLDHIAQLPDLSRLQGDGGPLALANLDHADAYWQFLSAKADGKSAAASLQNPMDWMAYGFAPRTQLSGPTAAALRCNGFSRAVASQAYAYQKIPRIGYYDDFGIVAPKA